MPDKWHFFSFRGILISFEIAQQTLTSALNWYYQIISSDITAPESDQNNKPAGGIALRDIGFDGA